MGLGTGKTKADQHLSAPGLAETVSRRAAALLGKTSRIKTQGSTNPRGACGEVNPASRTWSGCCRQGSSSLAPSSKACSHLSWSQPLPLSPTLPPPQGKPMRGHIPASNQGMCSHEHTHEPLPLEASCQCIALWSLNTLLAHTQATASFLTPLIPPVLRWCWTCHG